LLSPRRKLPRMSFGTLRPDLVAYEKTIVGASGMMLRESGAECWVSRQNGRTEYRAAIPWAEMPGLAPGDEFGLALAINDDDGEVRGCLQWPPSGDQRC